MAFFSSAKKFTTSQQIKTALYQLKSLDDRQRSVVYQALVKELDDGGVSTEEIKKVVRVLRAQGEISEIDKNELLNLMR